MTYWEDHRQDLKALFQALERFDDWVDDQAIMVAYMQSRWLGKEHGAREGKDSFSPDTLRQAWPHLRTLGVIDPVDPPCTSYDHILVMGATGIGLHRRLELVRLSKVGGGTLTVLAGQRPHEGNSRDGGIDELLATDGRFAAADPTWHPPGRLTYLINLLASANLDSYTTAAVLLPTETDLARVILTKHWPDLALLSVHVAPSQGLPNELGVRVVQREDYGRPAGPIRDFQLLNAAPVDRDLPDQPRPARPTTRSTVREWLKMTPAGEIGDVLIVVNQPHLARVRIEVEDVFRLAGRVPARVDVAGCGVQPDAADLLLLLGEIPARITTESAGH